MKFLPCISKKKKKSIFLYQLNNASKTKKHRNRFLEKATQQQLNQIRNLCFHLCKKKLKIDPRLRRKLNRYRKDIRDLASKNKLKTLHGLRDRLKQRGGFLPLLLPAILGLVSSVGSKLVEKAIGV